MAIFRRVPQYLSMVSAIRNSGGCDAGCESETVVVNGAKEHEIR